MVSKHNIIYFSKPLSIRNFFKYEKIKTLSYETYDITGSYNYCVQSKKTKTRKSYPNILVIIITAKAIFPCKIPNS